MARKKIKLAWIPNDSARRSTFKKRKKGLMKKVSELSTLCGVNACALVFSPYDAEPEVWPPPPEVQQVLTRFKSLPQMEQCRKMMNQEGFLRQRIGKTRDQLKKQQRDNREREMIQLMNQNLTGQKGLQEVSVADLGDLAWLVDERIKAICDRIQLLKLTAPPPPPPPPQFVPVVQTRNNNVVVTGEQVKSPLHMTMETLQGQPWFMDVMNPNENMGCTGNDMFGDATAAWTNGLFP